MNADWPPPMVDMYLRSFSMNADSLRSLKAFYAFSNERKRFYPSIIKIY